jgi:gliding motility-associated-like protein
VICDDDGTATFDLTLREADIYGTQALTDYTLTYHESQADADAGTPFIATPQTYINTMNPQDIFVRLEDNTSVCFSTGVFQIEANLGPVVTQPVPFEQCDDLGMVNDGITTFDLTTQNATITGGVAGVSVTYHNTQADADAGTNAIDPDTAYVNQVNGEIVFARVEDSNTECVDTTITLTLVVNPNPQPVTPTPLELCDDNTPGDGMEVFNLTDAEAEILNGNTTFDVLYYENQADALGGDPTLAIAAADLTAYTNMSNPQIIYVRVTNPASGCFEIVELQLIVNPLPDDTAAVEDYIICEIGTDGQATFDLTTKDGEILNGQDPLIFVVTYYEDMADAVAGNNALTITAAQSYENDITLPSPPGQPIFFGIENTVTGCYIGGNSFNLQVLEGATATAPVSEYVICDNEGENDGFALFDLTDTTDPTVVALLAEILGTQSAPDYVLTFHESPSNAMDGTNAITFPYMNVINPQEIYARVTNATTDCFDVASVILKVEQLPDVTLDETYRLCVDENGLPIVEEFGDVSPPVIDTGLDPNLFTFEWTLDGAVLVGQTGPSIVAVAGGLYTVTYTEIATGCSNTIETTVTVSSPPTTFSAEVVSGAFANEHTIEAMAEGLGEYVFSLDDGTFQSEGVFTNVQPGDHIVTIQDVNGCGTVIIEVGVVDYPRFFTPNEDGYHDTWNIIGIASADPTAKIYIFDRGGKLLKQISPLSTGWDGSYNGNPLPSSDYWFRIEYKEDERTKEFKGHFTLKR